MSEQSQSQTESRVQYYEQLDKVQGQRIRRYIWLPFILLLLIMVLIIGILISMRTPTQVALVSDFMLTLFVLCPLVICLFPIVLLMGILIVMMNRLYHGTKSPLRRLEQWTHKMEKRVDTWTSMADSRVLNWAVRFAPIHHILSIFDEPSPNKEDEGDPNVTKSTDK